VTIVRVGATKKYTDGWDAAFGKGKKKASAGANKTSATKASTKKKSAKKGSSAKKSAKKKTRAKKKGRK
jgi:hypothetical protein